jgi:hypothetical protein
MNLEHRTSHVRPSLGLACLLIFGGARAGHADQNANVDLRYERSLDDATDRGLVWLAAKQGGDGCIGDRHKGTTTALAAMAFLAKGHTPGLGPYGEKVNRAVDYVVGGQDAAGQLARDGRMYGHSIATLMLSEVSGMLDPQRQNEVDEALAKALRLILKAQEMPKDPKHQGGWRYEAGSRDSDMSLTGWAVMALRSARNAGCAVPKESIEAGVRFIMNCRSGAGFGYQPGGGATLPLTASGMLCLRLAGKDDPAMMAKGAEFIMQQPVGQGGYFYYTSYYCSQAMFQLGGDRWEKYAAKLYDTMLGRQREDGAFPAAESDEAYATAMAVLALSPAYRQLPIYQR